MVQTFDTSKDTLKLVQSSGIIAVLRGYDRETCVQVTHALVAGGIRVVEVTMDSPDPTSTIATLKEEFAGEQDMVIGAGTVLDKRSAEEAIQAGAMFLFAPNLETEVVLQAVNAGILAIPGVLTPTEMTHAHRLGAKAVKLFPASVVGPGFIKQMQGPLSHIPIIPTGGISVDQAADYMRAGAIAVGAGGSLLGDDVSKGRFDLIQDRAAAWVSAVRQHKEMG